MGRLLRDNYATEVFKLCPGNRGMSEKFIDRSAGAGMFSEVNRRFPVADGS